MVKVQRLAVAAPETLAAPNQQIGEDQGQLIGLASGVRVINAHQALALRFLKQCPSPFFNLHF